MTGINHRGEWDIASSNNLPNDTPQNGDYYVLSSGGSDSLGNSWSPGDWAIYSDDSSSWQKIPSAGTYQSFAGQTGDIMPSFGHYKFLELDLSSATLDSFSDVDLTTAPNIGDVLKFNNSKWSAEVIIRT